MFRRGWVAAATIGLLVLGVAAGCTSDSNSDNSTRDENGNITGGGDVGVFQLEVGDCFTQPADGNVTQVSAVPCTQHHDSELFAKFDIAGGDDAPFPGPSSVQHEAQTKCTGDLFTNYVGVDFNTSALQATSLNPTQQ